MGNCGYGTYYTDGELEGTTDNEIESKRQRMGSSTMDILIERFKFQETHTLIFGATKFKVDERYYLYLKDNIPKGELIDDKHNIIVAQFVNSYIESYNSKLIQFHNLHYDIPSIEDSLNKFIINEGGQTDFTQKIPLVINAIKFIRYYDIDFLGAHKPGEYSTLEHIFFMYLTSTADNTLETIVYLEKNDRFHVIITDLVHTDNYVGEMYKYFYRKLKYNKETAVKYKIDERIGIELYKMYLAKVPVLKVVYTPFLDINITDVRALQHYIDFDKLGIQLFNITPRTTNSINMNSYRILKNTYVFEKLTEWIIDIDKTDYDAQLLQLNKIVTVRDGKEHLHATKNKLTIIPNFITSLYINVDDSDEDTTNAIINTPYYNTIWRHITKLTANNIGYLKLNGLENYENITYLDISDNEDINLNYKDGIKIPPLLKTLICEGDYITTTILKNLPLTLEELNISRCYIDCKEDDVFSDVFLNFTYLTNLKKLKCSSLEYTNLIKLELPDGLEELECAFNKLTVLTCNKNLKRLICYENELTKLKLNDGLEELNCHDNKDLILKTLPSSLKKIICDDLKNITLLDGLKELHCGDYKNKLPVSLEILFYSGGGDLDFTYLTNLKELRVNNTVITSLKLPENLKELRVNNTVITSLKLPENLIKCVCTGNKSLTTLTCNKNLKYLNCSENKLTKLELNDGLESLTCNKNLKYLNCSENKLTELELNDGLESLTCDINRITELKLPNSLEYLSCHGNQLTLLKCNNNLKRLICYENELTKLKLNDGLRELIFESIDTSDIKFPKSLERIIYNGKDRTMRLMGIN